MSQYALMWIRDCEWLACDGGGFRWTPIERQRTLFETRAKAATARKGYGWKKSEVEIVAVSDSDSEISRLKATIATLTTERDQYKEMGDHWTDLHDALRDTEARAYRATRLLDDAQSQVLAGISKKYHEDSSLATFNQLQVARAIIAQLAALDPCPICQRSTKEHAAACALRKYVSRYGGSP